MEKEKTKSVLSKNVFIIFVVALVLSIGGIAFAYYYAILEGNNVNTAKTASASLIYTEPIEGIETETMTDGQGILSENTYDFTVTGSSKGNASLGYVIYAEEEEGNTVAASDIKVLLTDENNIPDSEYIDTSSPEKSIYGPEGNIAIQYSNGAPYTLKISGQIIDEGITQQPMEELYRNYAGSVLDLEEGGTFYISSMRYNMETDSDEKKCFQYKVVLGVNGLIEETEEEVQASKCSVTLKYVYNEETEKKEYTIVEDSTSTEQIKLEEAGEWQLTIKDWETDKTTTEYYSLEEYLVEKLGANYYIKNVFKAINKEGSQYDIYPYSYCVKTNESGVESEIVDDKFCENSYQHEIGTITPKRLGDIKDEATSLDNVIGRSTMTFESGKLTYMGKGDFLYSNEGKLKNPRQYKLRYWISSDMETNTDENTKQETTTTNEGNTHSVEFGGNEIFKFRINVYARQI